MPHRQPASRSNAFFWSIFAAALSCGSLAVGVSPALADLCSQMAVPPTVAARVTILEPKLKINEPMRVMSADPRNAVPHWMDGPAKGFGATSVSAKAKWTLTVRSMQRADGGFCTVLQHVVMELSARTEVSIAKEIPRGSCVWNIVVDHERKHVNLDRKMFPYLSKEIEQRVRARFPGAVAAPDMDTGERILSASLEKFINAIVAEFAAKRNERQLTIDTRREYERPRRACGDPAVDDILRRAGY
jgi:hypothetical protein